MAWRNPPAAIASSSAVGRIMAAELGWDRARMRAEVAEFVAEMRSASSGETLGSSENDEAERA